MTMPKIEPCRSCGHGRHAHGDGRCGIKTVTGAPSTEGRPVLDSYEHVGRTVTPCECTGYVTELNGAA